MLVIRRIVSAVAFGVLLHGMAVTGVMGAERATELKKIGQHGSWATYAIKKKTMVVDQFDDGSTFAIVETEDGSARVYVASPTWNLAEGQDFRFSIDIDGATFSGTASGVARDKIRMGDDARAFLPTLAHGRTAVLMVADLRLEMSLLDAAAAIDDAARYRASSKE